MNVGIVGLGLIGGSMAKSIKCRTSHRVFGIDINSETMTLARLCGAIDEKLTDETAAECDFIIIALRPGDTVEWVRKHAPIIPVSATVIDMCGVKRAVVSEITPIAEKYGFRYIGGHPMAGKERGGFTSSADGLFCGASMVLTPDSRTDIALLERVKELFYDVGFATMTFSTPEEHDRIIAFTSQLAHIVSGAYVKSPEAQKRRGFSAGSFNDMTRVARLDENMWTELFMDNDDFLCTELDILIQHLSEYRDALRSGDRDALCALLKEGREKKATAGGN